MMQPPLNTGATFTKPSPWVWRVSVDSTRVGTVYGDAVIGFTARDIDFHLIGRCYVSAQAAMHACVLATSTVTSPQPADRRASRRTA